MWALVVVVLVMSCVGIGVYVREKNEDRRRADEERDQTAEQVHWRSEVDQRALEDAKQLVR
jgi:hypothetical protein